MHESNSGGSRIGCSPEKLEDELSAESKKLDRERELSLCEGLVQGCGPETEDGREQIANGTVEVSKRSVSLCFWP